MLRKLRLLIHRAGQCPLHGETSLSHIWLPHCPNFQSHLKPCGSATNYLSPSRITTMSIKRGALDLGFVCMNLDGFATLFIFNTG